MKKQLKNIDIVLQPKLGDSILSLPGIICLKQLIDKYDSGNIKVRIISTNKLTKVFKSFEIAEVKELSFFSKIQSQLFPADKVFFLATSSKNMMYKGTETFGQVMNYKKHIKYDYNLPCLSFKETDELLPAELINFLKTEYKLSTISISIFGICLELGYTAEQIISTFKFDKNSLIPKCNFTKWTPDFDKYAVFCLEAANNRRNDADRRWSEESYLEIAEYIYKKYSLTSVFIGTNNKSTIPSKAYFIDLRKKLDLVNLTQLLKCSIGYIGNDTGPLHIANLMQKKSVGIYLREASTIDYSPLFPELNTIIIKPENTDIVYPAVDELCSAVFAR